MRHATVYGRTGVSACQPSCTCSCNAALAALLDFTPRPQLLPCGTRQRKGGRPYRCVILPRHVYVSLEQEIDVPCRRRERYWQGGGRGLLEAWVSRTSPTPASTINPENSTVQCQSGDWRSGCGWGRSCGLFYHNKWRVRPFRPQYLCSRSP